MDNKKYLIACAVAFIFVFIFDWVFHGVILKSMYEATHSLWRPEAKSIMPLMFAGQLLFPFIFGYIFTRGYENKGVMEGVRFGLLIALLFLPTHLIIHSVQPLPLSLTLSWIAGDVVELSILGAIIAVLYKPADAP